MGDVSGGGKCCDEGRIGVGSGVRDGEHAAQLVLEAIQHVNLVGGADDDVLETAGVQTNGEDDHVSNGNGSGNGNGASTSSQQKKAKISRLYGWTARGTDIVAQDEGTFRILHFTLCTAN